MLLSVGAGISLVGLISSSRYLSTLNFNPELSALKHFESEIIAVGSNSVQIQIVTPVYI